MTCVVGYDSGQEWRVSQQVWETLAPRSLECRSRQAPQAWGPWTVGSGSRTVLTSSPQVRQERQCPPRLPGPACKSRICTGISNQMIQAPLCDRRSLHAARPSASFYIQHIRDAHLGRAPLFDTGTSISVGLEKLSDAAAAVDTDILSTLSWPNSFLDLGNLQTADLVRVAAFRPAQAPLLGTMNDIVLISAGHCCALLGDERWACGALFS